MSKFISIFLMISGSVLSIIGIIYDISTNGTLMHSLSNIWLFGFIATLAGIMMWLDERLDRIEKIWEKVKNELHRMAIQGI